MEKQGVVKPGLTPSEKEGEKSASAEELENCPEKRFAAAVEKNIKRLLRGRLHEREDPCDEK